MSEEREPVDTPWLVCIRDTRHANCPPELKRAFEEAIERANTLTSEAWYGSNPVAACEQLILLAEVLCLKISGLWSAQRQVLEEAVRGRLSLPVSLTKDPKTYLRKLAAEMLKELPLATEREGRGRRKGTRDSSDGATAIRKARSVLLREIRLFITAVREPGTIVSFRYVGRPHPATGDLYSQREERDAIDLGWRERLLSESGRAHRDWWRDEFLSYVKECRPDLLTAKRKGGKLACLLSYAKGIHPGALTKNAAFDRYVEDAFRTPLKHLLSP